MTRPPRCCVVGLGNIGGAIATRLAATGAEVFGVDEDPAARQRFTGETGRPALAALTKESLADGDRIFVVVRTIQQSNEVLDRLSVSGCEITVFVMTTLDPQAAKDLGRKDRPNLRIIELPVSGGRSGAVEGTLTALAAGPLSESDLAFLEKHLVTTVVTFDNYGEPTTAKLYNNVLAAYHARAHAEILLWADRSGHNVLRLDALIATSSGASWMGQNLASVVDDLLEKDVALFEESFGELPRLSVGLGSALGESLAAARRVVGREST